MNASEPLRRNARLLPGEPAYVRKDGSTIPYEAMERDVDRIAQRLRELSCGPGDVAAVTADELYRYLCVTMALARVGAAIGPPVLPPGMATLVIGGTPVTGTRAVTMDELAGAGGATPDAPGPIHDDPQAIYAYCPSSGTTAGKPKIVPFTHELLRRRIAQRAISAPPVPGTRHVAMLALNSVFGLQRSVRTLWSGCAVVEPNLEGEDIAAWLQRTGVTFMTLSPIGLRRVLECLPEDAVRCPLALIELGGGLVPASVQAMATQRLPAALLHSSYGSTETGPVAAAPLRALGGRADAVGFAQAGVRIEIVDAEGNVLPAGSEGRVRVQSAHAAATYIDNPEATARTFRDGWVYPNDNGVLDPDGALRLLGRVDDVINIDGVKVAPQALEDVLLTLADLREVAIFSIVGANGMTTLGAAIVPNKPLNADAFRERCRVKLGRYAPTLIVKMTALPRNAMGKVLRTELAARTRISSTSGSESA